MRGLGSEITTSGKARTPVLRLGESIMQLAKCPAAIGLFDDPEEALKAMAELRARGFLEEEIGFAGPQPPKERGGGGTLVLEGAATGALAGGAVGGLVGVALGAGLMPAIGPIVTGVLLAEILATAATGAAAGGILGALGGMGVSDEEAQFYDSEVRAGRAIVTIKSPSRSAEAADLLRRHGARQLPCRETDESRQPEPPAGPPA
jgi:hypothetical protein